jgi:hypothetical protein
MSLVFSNLSISIAYRVFKKAVDLTRPTPERQDAPLHGGGPSKVRDAKNNDATFADGREVHVAPNKARTFVNARETVSGPCPVSA